ncbi:unnamed protein product [Phytophthora fragariaefolia]|uniref:Unnamed protein product n=1 Tax=Phytophthora fragariaefolia TaxID=1490495 RepID=A0A9W6U4D8_9STRA|nr:unnamed protein product [Phytophthora fragariaefolia]
MQALSGAASKASVAFIMNSSENCPVNVEDEAAPASTAIARPSPRNGKTSRRVTCVLSDQQGGKKCSAEGCTSSAKNAGLCWRHGTMVVARYGLGDDPNRLVTQAGGSSATWKAASVEASRGVFAGPMEAAPSARELTAPRSLCQTVCAGPTEAANAACSEAARKRPTNATRTTARNTSPSEHVTPRRIAEVMRTNGSITVDIDA